MKGTEAFQELLPLIEDNVPVVHANGFICRESFALKDRKANFYMIGSMGLASSIGLGVAMYKPEKKVIIIDGDGNDSNASFKIKSGDAVFSDDGKKLIGEKATLEFKYNDDPFKYGVAIDSISIGKINWGKKQSPGSK